MKKLLNEDDIDYSRQGCLERKKLAGVSGGHPLFESMSRKSMLVEMAKQYLVVRCGWQASQRAALIVEAGLIAGRGRAAFGNFDERDLRCCARVIESVTRANPPKAHQPRPRITEEDYVARVMREAKQREETAERLRYFYS